MQRKTIHKIIAMSIMILINIATYATDVRIRGQSVDTARELAGWTNHVNLYDMGGLYGSFAITPEYTQSFDGRQIARSLFGSAIDRTFADDTCERGCSTNNAATFRISGSQAATRRAGDLLADYFGLPLDYQSTVTVRPEIQNFLVDFDFFIGLDEWVCGLWFRIHAPVVYAKWKLRMDEIQLVTPIVGYPAGYFGPAAVGVADLNTSFLSYLNGNVPTIGNGVTFEPLAASKYFGGDVTMNTNSGTCSSSCNHGDHTTRLSDIRFAFGWNFWQDEDYHIGAGILASAPTGTRVDDKLLFQPFVGNGHHWEIGGKFTGHYTFWRSCDHDDISFGFYLDADITYMFATPQFRTFDLCGAGDNSKYMLAELMTAIVTDLTAGDDFTVPSSQFDAVFTPVANIVQGNVKVSQDIQVDLTAMFNYTHCGFAWDLGYNFWLTSAEKIQGCGNNSTLVASNYALKGDASVYGFTSTPAGDAVALSATESSATICSGTNMILSSPSVTATTSVNQRVDNPQLAYNAAGADPLVNSVGAQDYTSLDPILLSDSNLDIQGAKCKGISNRVFTHFSYTWEDHDCYVPYFGIGGSAEFVVKDKNCSMPPCSNSSGCTVITTNSSCCSDDNSRAKITNISQWGVWVKGGVSFN